MINDIRSKIDLNYGKQLELIIEQLGIHSYLKTMDNYDDRVDHIDELLSKLVDVTDLETFLNEVALFQDIDSFIHEKVVVTLHSAKG